MTTRDKAIKAHMAKVKGETDMQKLMTLVDKWSKQKNCAEHALEETFAARMIPQLTKHIGFWHGKWQEEIDRR